MATVPTYLIVTVLIGYFAQHDVITAQRVQRVRSSVNPTLTQYRAPLEGSELFETPKVAEKGQLKLQQVGEGQPWKNVRIEEINSLRTVREANDQDGALESYMEAPRKPPKKERNTKKHWKLEKDLGEKLVIARRKQLEKKRSEEETRMRQIKEEEEIQMKLDDAQEKKLNERDKQVKKKEEEEKRKALDALKPQNVKNYEEERKVDEKLERDIQTNLERAREEEGPDSKSAKKFEGSLAEVRERQKKRTEKHLSELAKYRERQKELENLPKNEVTNTRGNMRTFHAVYVGCNVEKDCKKNPDRDDRERKLERERQQRLQREKAERIAKHKLILEKYREREREIGKRRQQEIEEEQKKVQVLSNLAAMISPSSLLNVVDEMMPVLNPTQFPQETR